MTVRILVGHVLDRLAELPDESVHCVVSSPPYYGLRDYGIEPQVWGGDPECRHVWGDEKRLSTGRNDAERLADGLADGHGGGTTTPKQQGTPSACCRRCTAWRGSLGLEPTLDLYLDHLVEIFREVRRVMRKDATCWLNIGDSYDSGTSGARKPTQTGKYGYWENPVIDRRVTSTNTKAKDLMLIPSRLAIRLCDDGWWVRSDIAWCKKAPMPESCTDRPTSAWEHVFLLTKSGDSTFWTHRDHAGSRTRPAPDYRWVDHDNDDAETDVEPPNWRTEIIRARKGRVADGFHGGETVPGQAAHASERAAKRWSRINLWAAHDYFYDAEAVKEEASPNTAAHRAKNYKGPIDNGRISDRNDAGRTCRGDLTHRNLRNFWLLGPEPFAAAHFATFPTEIPRRAILAGTSEKGVCPKCGAPWARQASISYTPSTHAVGMVGNMHKRSDDRAMHAGREGQRRMDKHVETIGWQPTCGCDAGDPIPATVLDPFIGAGTTGLVADRLQRDCIGIDLSRGYAAMAEARIRSDNSLFTEIAAE